MRDASVRKSGALDILTESLKWLDNEQAGLLWAIVAQLGCVSQCCALADWRIQNVFFSIRDFDPQWRSQTERLPTTNGGLLI